MIKITPKMLMNDVEPISLENKVNRNQTLLEAMRQLAQAKKIKLIPGFWNCHEPLSVIKDSLLYKALILYYSKKVGDFNHYAKANIHGFLNNDLPSKHKKYGFYFHAKTDIEHPALTLVVFATLLKHVGTLPDFMKFVNRKVGSQK